MEDKAWELLILELREIKKDVKEMRKEMMTLKIKVASIGAIFGVIGAYVKYIFTGKFGG